jgi:hypothetical protein
VPVDPVPINLPSAPLFVPSSTHSGAVTVPMKPGLFRQAPTHSAKVHSLAPKESQANTAGSKEAMETMESEIQLVLLTAV